MSTKGLCPSALTGSKAGKVKMGKSRGRPVVVVDGEGEGEGLVIMKSEDEIGEMKLKEELADHDGLLMPGGPSLEIKLEEEDDGGEAR